MFFLTIKKIFKKNIKIKNKKVKRICGFCFHLDKGKTIPKRIAFFRHHTRLCNISKAYKSQTFLPFPSLSRQPNRPSQSRDHSQNDLPQNPGPPSPKRRPPPPPPIAAECVPRRGIGCAAGELGEARASGERGGEGERG